VWKTGPRQGIQASLGLADRLQQLGRPTRRRSSVSSDSILASREKPRSAGDTNARNSATRSVSVSTDSSALNAYRKGFGGEQIQFPQQQRIRARRRTASSRRRATCWAAQRGVVRAVLRSLFVARLFFPSRGTARSSVCRSARISSVSTTSMSDLRIHSTGDVGHNRRRRTPAPLGRSRHTRGCWPGNLLPSPAPFRGNPRTRPAMSTNVTGAGNDAL